MTAERTTVPFLDSLRASGLLTDAQLAELAKFPEARDAAPTPLARIILQRGWLTRFQLNMVAAGSAKGLTVGPYVVLDRLGEGGMGMVYKARHQHMQRIVALKVIRKEKLATPDAVNRFMREVQLAGALHHPNIVMAYDAGPAGNSYYFAMEYVDGVDLARLVKEKGPLPVAQACEYIRQAALGLQHAHKKGLIHRDVKPSNLLVSRDANTDQDVVKLLDMGLARVQGGGDTGLTKIGAVIGTPDYVAPEQAMNSKAADIRADLYSLGCSLYYLLSGQPPFLANELTEVLLKHQMEKPVPLAQRGVDVPKKVQAILDRLMAKHPDERYQTPAELIEDLEPFCGAGKLAESGGDFRSGEDATEEWAPSSAERPSRRKRDNAEQRKRRLLVLGIAGGSGLLLILGLVLYLTFSYSKPEQVAQGTTPAEPTRKGPSETGKTQQATDKGTKPVVIPPDGGNKPPIIPKEKFHGHEGDVTCVAFCDGARKLVSGGVDKTVCVWNFDNGKQLGRKELAAPIKCLAVTMDGASVWVGLADGSVTVLSLDPLETKPGGGLRTTPDSTIEALAASPDGRYVARVGNLDVPALYPLKPGVKPAFLLKERFSGNSVAFSSDGKLAALGGKDGTIHLFDVAGDEPKPTPPIKDAHKGRIFALAFVPNSPQVISAGEDGSLVAWNSATGQVVVRYHLSGPPINAVAVSANGKRVVNCDQWGNLRVRDVANSQEVTMTGHKGEVHGVIVSPDGQRVVSCGDAIRVWDNPEIVKPADSGVTCVAFCDGGNKIISGGTDKKIHVWDRATLQEAYPSKTMTGPITALCVMPDGKTVHVGQGDGEGHYFWIDKPDLRGTGKSDGTVIEALAPAPDGRCVGRVGRGIGPQLLEPTPATVVPHGFPENFDAHSIIFSPDGKQIAVGADNGTIHVYDVDEHYNIKKRQTIPNAHKGVIRGLAFMADSKELISAGADGKMVAWDVANGKDVRRYEIPPGPIGSLAVSADGKRIAAGASDGMIYLWEVAQTKPFRSQLGNKDKGEVRSLAFSADGKWLVCFGDIIRLADLRKL